MVKGCDTVMFCLSKGLGAPLGSMVVGSNNVIEKIRNNRKRLGGLLRKPGMIVQSCHISLDNIENFIGKAN
jgi:threonine aldolase